MRRMSVYCCVCLCVCVCVLVGMEWGVIEVIGGVGGRRIVAELRDVWVLVCRSIFL
jgi:hypothetical protein